jgi:hypothetical protein
VAEECTGAAGQDCPSDTVAPSQTPCDADGDVCTVDRCDGTGACTLSEPLDCEDGNTCTQDSCDPQNGCLSTGTPSPSCVPATRATVQVRNASEDLQDGVRFKWKGGPVLVADLGNPTQTTRYELCIYDDTGIRMAMGVPPGAGWTTLGSIASPRGYRYRDRLAQTQGVKQITLKASSLDRARLQLTGKGAALPDTTLPFLLPVTAQLHAGDDTCWEVELDASATRRNETRIFYGKTP